MNQTEKILFEQLQRHATHYIESSERGIVVDDLDVDSFIAETSKLVTANEVEQSASTCNLQNVSNRYLFWFEHEGKDGWTFEIEAKDYDEAYEKAYDTHGPQVDDMMYQLL